MGYPVALLDSCVMYRQGVRDLLMRLAVERLYAPRWSPDIHREWTRSLADTHPGVEAMGLEKLEANATLLNNHFPASLITGYESLIEGLSLPDPDDRHVLAAALVGKADVIVTYNLSDFPEEVLAALELRVQHPEDFMIDLFSGDWKAFCRAFKAQRLARKNPPRTVEERLEWLAKEHSRLEGILRDYTDDL